MVRRHGWVATIGRVARTPDVDLLAGYRVTRITWRQLTEQPNALASELTTLLDQPGNRQ